MLKPNWKNSILNVSATISDFLGNKNDIPKISLLQKYLNKGYKNIVFINIDGLGMYPLTQNLDKMAFLRKNIKKKITSTFPSTTTNATSTLCSATYPMQHGLFGWSLWIEEMQRNVAIYLGTDCETGEQLNKSFIDEKFKFDYYFEHTNGEYKCNAIFPPYIQNITDFYPYDPKNQNEIFELLEKICNRKTKQFVYCYSPAPDAVMHEFGVKSKEAKEIIAFLNDEIESFANKHKDTLIVVVPDHGQTQITDYVEMYKDENLLSTLKSPPFMEPRAIAFRIKPDMEAKFIKEIKKYRQLKLFKTETLINKNYFGKRTDKAHLLGDYIAIVNNNHSQFLIESTMPKFKGHHTGLTKREVVLPLIIIN